MIEKKAQKVFVSGKFAVIHSGHIRLFIAAKNLGLKLIVGLDTEGLDNSEVEWRTNFLKNQEFIDEVVHFESDLRQLILEIRPDLVIKGSEFSSQYNIEEELVLSYGGELIFSSGSTYFSETDLLSYKDSSASNFGNKIPHDFLVRNSLDLKKTNQIVAEFSNIKVCVVGDLIIDEYINCHPLGMSREEPTVVVTPVDSQKFLGGAGIVAAHTVGLGATTTLISIIGNDEVGRWSEEKLDEYGVLFQPIKDKNRPTNLKQRYRSGSQTLFKISHLNQDKTKATIEKEIITKFEALAPEIDLLILSDFSYGVFNKHTTKALISIAKKNGVFVSADSQTSSQIGDLTQFAGVDLITPTEIEARYELKDNVSGLAVIVENLRQKINPKHIILKLGADGMVFTGTNRNGQLSILDALPSLNNSPVDVSGAGDSLLAAASLALTAEENLSQAALLGSISAAMQVARVGNIPIQVENLRSFLK